VHVHMCHHVLNRALRWLRLGDHGSAEFAQAATRKYLDHRASQTLDLVLCVFDFVCILAGLKEGSLGRLAKA
jgi:hypothetical protein